jgi:hypothetical protein
VFSNEIVITYDDNDSRGEPDEARESEREREVRPRTGVRFIRTVQMGGEIAPASRSEAAGKPSAKISEANPKLDAEGPSGCEAS